MARILAVDDDSSMEAYYAALFSEAGYDVRTAPDTAAALKLYSDFKPDLLVLDAEMPEGGGERAFLVARPVAGSGIPVVFVTGLPERVIDFALTQTRVRVFKKPVKAEDLLSAVKELLA